MPKITVAANELYDVDATHVSLVKRGANRVPFRIIKTRDGQETHQMLNFSSLFRKEAEKPAGPTVAAVVVSKALSEKAARHVVTKAGFSADRLDGNVDGAYVFAQGDGEIDGTLLKMDDNVALVVTGDAIKKAFEGLTFEATAFNDVMAQEGFVPSVDLAMGMLRNTVSNILSKAEGRQDLVSKMETAIEEFGEFVSALASAVPEEAFRMEVMKYDDLPAEDDPAAEQPASEPASLGDKVAKAMYGKNKKRKETGAEEGDPVEAKKDDAGEVADDPEGGPTRKADDPAGADPADAIKAALTDALAPITAAIEGVRKSVAEQAVTIEGVKKDAETAREVAKAAERAVTGSVSGDAGDDPAPSKARKNDESYGEPPLIDTGYARIQ